MAEGDLHRAAKEQISEALNALSFCKNCATERVLADVRPDISLRINGVPVAVEIQDSAMAVEELYARTARYTKKGIYLLWVTPIVDEFTNGVEFRPAEWLRALHGLYFGKVFAWVGGANVLPVKFDRVEHYKEGGYDYDAEYHDDRTYTPKTIRKAVIAADNLHIAYDFSKLDRKRWVSGKTVIPAAKLWNAEYDAIKWQRLQITGRTELL